jgi:hypothetical protein
MLDVKLWDQLRKYCKDKELCLATWSVLPLFRTGALSQQRKWNVSIEILVARRYKNYRKHAHLVSDAKIFRGT